MLVTSCKVLTAACGSVGNLFPVGGYQAWRCLGTLQPPGRAGAWTCCPSTARVPNSASGARRRVPPVPAQGSSALPGVRPAADTLTKMEAHVRTSSPSCAEGARELWQHVGAVVEGDKGH